MESPPEWERYITSMRNPHVTVLSLGGTISMTTSVASTVLPTLGADDLTASLKHYLPGLDITALTLSKLGSPQLRVIDVLAALDQAHHAIDDGSCGVVIVQGTDTLEETAYLLDLVWDRDEPLVVTGAMRYADDAGAEGLGNLVASVRVAASADMRGQGVLVVLNDEVHAGAHVRKHDANHLQAFSSYPWGPMARLLEGRLHSVYQTQHRLPALPLPEGSPFIPLIVATLDDDGAAIRALIPLRPQGIVIAAMGSGHMPVAMADGAEEAVKAGIPVVFATRTGGGSVTKETYGYPGSEADLLRRGLISAGWLSSMKARLLLHVLVSAEYSTEQIARQFAIHGR